ncbi:MAG: GNAT family N-acetyltransferase [Planctomycetes bacterium]|nr:GNAT family N-acetyltransferase [Planctomycetota bacterium]
MTKITSDLFLPAAMRLVSQGNADVEAAGKRLVAASGKHGIDLSLAWGTVQRFTGKQRPIVRQACLAVLGAGKTAMMFVSEPPRTGDAGGTEAGIAERAACIQAACGFLSASPPSEIRIVQALPEPRETYALEAYARAGFRNVGSLTYMRRSGLPVASGATDPSWPQDVRIVAYDELADGPGGTGRADALVSEALDRSYEQTQDCPEMCGLRETRDVVQSHRSVGTFDPHFWWIVMSGDEAHGCLLLNPCPEQRSVELVYIGLSVKMRGRGLAKTLLSWGIARTAPGRAGWDVSCAVDDRNTSAQALYRGLGFKDAGKRVALVRPLAEHNPR